MVKSSQAFFPMIVILMGLICGTCERESGLVFFIMLLPTCLWYLIFLIYKFVLINNDDSFFPVNSTIINDVPSVEDLVLCRRILPPEVNCTMGHLTVDCLPECQKRCDPASLATCLDGTKEKTALSRVIIPNSLLKFRCLCLFPANDCNICWRIQSFLGG